MHHEWGSGVQFFPTPRQGSNQVIFEQTNSGKELFEYCASLVRVSTMIGVCSLEPALTRSCFINRQLSEDRQLSS